MKKNSWITIGILIAVIILAYLLINKSKPETPEEIAKCIGEKSELYVQLGCSHCKTQEEMFGENLKHLKVTDCFYEREKCAEKEITGTPTWIIGGEKYDGIKSIKKLKELTEC